MTGRVLLIENDVPSMELMFHLLTTYGYFPQRARNGEEGLKIAAREHPDLIVSDIQMPFVDGFEVARRIRADPGLSSIPLLAVSAFATVADRRRTLAAGFDGYLSKPISPETFVQHIEAFLRPEFRAGMPFSPVPETDPPAPTPHGRKILVVDDIEANLHLATVVLGGAGYQVATATSMSEALRLARHDPPDLILSDIVMADGSGYEFIRAVKSDLRLRSIPFVFNTASMTAESAQEKCLALGAVKVLFRPIAPEDLLRELESCVREHAGG
jgi:two-component system cell cycle response regulator